MLSTLIKGQLKTIVKLEKIKKFFVIKFENLLTDPGTILVKLKKFLNSDFIKNPKKYLKKERLPRKYDYASTLKKKNYIKKN